MNDTWLSRELNVSKENHQSADVDDVGVASLASGRRGCYLRLGCHELFFKVVDTLRKVLLGTRDPLICGNTSGNRADREEGAGEDCSTKESRPTAGERSLVLQHRVALWAHAHPVWSEHLPCGNSPLVTGTGAIVAAGERSLVLQHRVALWAHAHPVWSEHLPCGNSPLVTGTGAIVVTLRTLMLTFPGCECEACGACVVRKRDVMPKWWMNSRVDRTGFKSLFVWRHFSSSPGGGDTSI
eukprot:CAMPEP_0185211868 /NCGR_PEP_ID=MMETSP1140-20130426/67232_1 /TAXON_ID=298111 /ORGANISM="Pavlova sp., Strain CCMP459" /LENGTH=239 /DNA_ID=CAMNT_0027779711 /DNA_START=541 /DNA_END=1259 /DNA_ORIENTATION=+